MAPLFLCVFGQKNCHMARKVAPMRGYEPGADPVVRGMLHKRGGGWCALGADFSTAIRIWLCLKAHSRPDSSSSISVFMSAP